MTRKPTLSATPPGSTGSVRRRVFLVDDHAVVRQGIGFLINMQDDLVVCGEANEGPQAMKGVQECKPDTIIVDITLEQGSGLELIKDLRAVAPHVPILVVTMHDERVYGERALRAGASGYITKGQAIEQVIDALRVILDGKLYVSHSMAERILSQRIGRSDDAPADPVDRLSDRELEIFKLIGNWKSTREIAGCLGLSIKTIEYYREQLKKKLGVKSGADLGQAATAWVQENCNGGSSAP
jgi:DNA-binding NarL/FixJ family response regulator